MSDDVAGGTTRRSRTGAKASQAASPSGGFQGTGIRSLAGSSPRNASRAEWQGDVSPRCNYRICRSKIDEKKSAKTFLLFLFNPNPSLARHASSVRGKRPLQRPPWGAEEASK